MNLKKSVSALLIASSLTMAAPARQAQAGAIFTPAGVGIVVLVIGIVYHNVLLIVLDQDGSANHDQLATALGQRFPAIEDREVLNNMADAIRGKAESTVANEKGEKMVNFSREEVLNLIAPTGLAEINPAAAEQIVADLK
jgi:hypothetical protein